MILFRVYVYIRKSEFKISSFPHKLHSDLVKVEYRKFSVTSLARSSVAQLQQKAHQVQEKITAIKW